MKVVPTDILNQFQLLNMTNMKQALLLFLFSFIHSISHGQAHYELADKRIFIDWNIIKYNADSMKITAKLINISADEIWLCENDFLFDPEIRGKSLYLNIGEDLNRYSPMDIVPFPLKAVKKGDSATFVSTKRFSDYSNIQIICNYLSKDDYGAILKKKKKPSLIGSLDYYRLMESLSIYLDLK